jgi:hypothetical protein
MASEKNRLKGISKDEFRARILAKRAKELWHFGPKPKESSNGIEALEKMVRRLRLGES